MRRLGYERYAVQGTDVGSGVAGMLADGRAGDAVVGVHITGTMAAMPFGPAIDARRLVCRGSGARRAL